MLIVGLTGGIASGKSTVSRLLAETHGLPVVDADVIARDILEPPPLARAVYSGRPAYKAVVAHFGSAVLLPDSDRIDRAELGQRVFGSADDRRALNAITHPAVRREMLRQVTRHWLRGASTCVCDVPLLIEAGLWRFVGEVVVVYVNDETQLARLLARPPIPPNPPLSHDDAVARMRAQMPLAEKVNYATAILCNNGTEDEIRTAVAAQVASWRAHSRRWPTSWACWVCPPLGLLMGIIKLGRRWLAARELRLGQREGQRSRI